MDLTSCHGHVFLIPPLCLFSFKIKMLLNDFLSICFMLHGMPLFHPFSLKKQVANVLLKTFIYYTAFNSFRYIHIPIITPGKVTIVRETFIIE